MTRRMRSDAELEAWITKKHALLDEMTRRHKLTRATIFSQNDLQRKLGLRFSMGMCAGLVQVWWAELRKGKDGIEYIRQAEPSLIREMLLYQTRSIYLKGLPSSNRDLSASETDLLAFKYGTAMVSEIESLMRLFNVSTTLELDLVLQHELPLLQKWEFDQFGPGLLRALCGSSAPGLRLLLLRFRRPKRVGGEKGHRSALVIGAEGEYRFYDPRYGELCFSAGQRFADWFTDYWAVGRWERLVQRGLPASPPIRVFRFGGRFSPAASQKIIALRARILDSHCDIEGSYLRSGPVCSMTAGLQSPSQVLDSD